MDYPGNSNASKNPAPQVNEPVVEKMITGTVVTRKKPLHKRFVEAFGPGDGRGVVEYVVLDIIVPAAKDTLADAVSQGFERLIFGEARSTSRRTGGRPVTAGTGSYVNYNRYTTGTPIGSNAASAGPSRAARANHDFREVLFEMRVEADQVLDRMYDILRQYERVRVADFYTLVGVTPQFTDNKYGWTSLQGSDIARVHGGYLLDLPQPVQLD